jgi:16S rRNA (cytosine967-C5)-methyltransferase
LTIRLVSPSAEAELTGAGIVLAPGQLLTAARVVSSGDVTATAAFREGRIRVQDEGSQLVAELAAGGAKGLTQHEQRILDACAAPGGKTLILSERNMRSLVVACESSEPRMEAMRLRLAPLGARVECRLADATTLAGTDASSFDIALADVPCSGTGTLGRNPEIRHRLRPEDLARQAERQCAILRAAVGCVRPGGRVIYSTCSLEPEENDGVVHAVLAGAPNARAASLYGSIKGLVRDGILLPSAEEELLARLTPEGALRLLPGAFQTDGFFIALIERTA